MDNQIISVLNALCEKIGIAVDWTTENVGPQIETLLEQYARYLTVNNIAGLVASVAVLSLGILSGCILYRSIQNDGFATDGYDDFTGLGWLCLTICILGIIFGLAGLIVTVNAVIKCFTIPQIYATQELLEMLQQ